MEELHRWWEVPAVAYFFHTFRDAFDLFPIEIEELESLLLGEGIYFPHCPPLETLAEKLLCGYVTRRRLKVWKAKQKSWQDLFGTVINKNETENVKHKKILSHLKEPFETLSPRQKIEVLHLLCEFRVQADSSMDDIKDIPVNSLRLMPIGVDSNNNNYWYFFGLRLYVEEPMKHNFYLKDQNKISKKSPAKSTVKKTKPVTPSVSRSERYYRRVRNCDKVDPDPGVIITEEKKPEIKVEDSKPEETQQCEPEVPLKVTGWSAACMCLQDWSDLSVVLSKSSDAKDKALAELIQTKYLPLILNITTEREKLSRKRNRSLQASILLEPRQSSRIALKKIKALEEESKDDDSDFDYNDDARPRRRNPPNEVKKIISREERYAMRNIAKDDFYEDFTYRPEDFESFDVTSQQRQTLSHVPNGQGAVLEKVESGYSVPSNLGKSRLAQQAKNDDSDDDSSDYDVEHGYSKHMTFESSDSDEEVNVDGDSDRSLRNSDGGEMGVGYLDSENSWESQPPSDDRLESDLQRGNYSQENIFTSRTLKAAKRLKEQEQEEDLFKIKHLSNRILQSNQEEELGTTYSGASNYTQILNQTYTNGLLYSER